MSDDEVRIDRDVLETLVEAAGTPSYTQGIPKALRDAVEAAKVALEPEPELIRCGFEGVAGRCDTSARPGKATCTYHKRFEAQISSAHS